MVKKSSMHMKTGFIFLVICLALQVQGSTETPNKINRDEAKLLADTSGSDKSERTTKRSRVSTIRRIFDMAKHRTKRSSFFPTGVKVCPQESVKQILASHQAYYRLRVCQEAVWEAFRIFLDRIPDATEYQNWVTACQRETFCIFDIGKNFSNSQEHLEIIQRRVKHRTFQDRKEEISTEKIKKPEEPPSLATAPTGTLVNEIVNDTKVPMKEIKPEVPNIVSEHPVEQMVEFSVTLTNQEYTPELSDPTTPQYQKLAAKFQLQMQKIFEKLAGFKEIRVLGFRQKKEKDGTSSTIARYVVNFERDESEVKGLPDEISTIGSNKVENEKVPLGAEGEIPAVKPSVADLQQMVAMALQEDKSLSMDLGTLQFTDAEVRPSSDADNALIDAAAGPGLEVSDQKSEDERMQDQISIIDSQIIPGEDVKIAGQPESSGDDLLPALSTLPYFIGSPGLPSVSEEDVFGPTEPIILVPAVTTSEPSAVIDLSLEATDSAWVAPTDSGFEMGIATELGAIDLLSPATLEEEGSGYFALPETPDVTPAPPLKYVTTSAMTTAAKGKELVVFFSLRVTNMHFSDDLFNRSSAEYKSLEQQFMQLLLPYLQSNLTGFKQLEILSFRNGSVIVNSKMKFAKSVPYNITEAVHCVLEDFCDAAAQRLNLEIDSYSLDIEPADQADPCKFMACDEFSRCVKNDWTKEADCLCKPGYVRKDGLPCQSLCEIEPQLCVNGDKCELVPGRGAVCRCPVHRNRERCSKYTPAPIRSNISKAVMLGLLCLIFLFITLIIKLRRKCKCKTNVAGPPLSPYSPENAVRINPAFDHDEPISSFCRGPCSVSACSNSSESSDQGTLQNNEHTTENGGHQTQSKD
ncbi:interphotoreceptor matrix proteoglycan 1 isoform X1 [Anolis sagrei]|uniref:interphotoreceptor matrix proteoglycan 1 isoform X1 n=1 Tax=Anolis sagrei TaxID=38937 RepID=UPI003522C555